MGRRLGKGSKSFKKESRQSKMSSLNSFIDKFGGRGEDSGTPDSTLVNASAPNALGTFLDTFSNLTESYFFYDKTVELRFNTTEHIYYRVEELGNLVPVHGVTQTLHVIDKSYALVPWAVKKAAEKLLCTIPLSDKKDEFGSFLLAPLTLEDFTKLVMTAKDAHKEILTDAGDVGHLAHKSIEDSIQHAINSTAGIVQELLNLPTDEKALSCTQAAFAWMHQHKVKWLKTENKIYSREYEYAGTLDGLAYVSSCDDPSCCAEKFVDSLSLIDWKTSNAIRTEYAIQVAGAYAHAEQEEHGVAIQNCFVLRLGKDGDESGKFEPYRIPSSDFPEAFQGFLACLSLVKVLDSIKERMSLQKKGVRDAKKLQREAQKALDKAAEKTKREAEKAQLKLDRAAEKERIKVDAKKAREEAKNAKVSKTPVLDTVRPTVTVGIAETGTDRVGTDKGSPESVVSPVEDYPEMTEQVSGILEETKVERKPFVISEEG